MVDRNHPWRRSMRAIGGTFPESAQARKEARIDERVRDLLPCRGADRGACPFRRWRSASRLGPALPAAGSSPGWTGSTAPPGLETGSAWSARPCSPGRRSCVRARTGQDGCGVYQDGILFAVRSCKRDWGILRANPSHTSWFPQGAFVRRERLQINGGALAPALKIGRQAPHQGGPGLARDVQVREWPEVRPC